MYQFKFLHVSYENLGMGVGLSFSLRVMWWAREGGGDITQSIILLSTALKNKNNTYFNASLGLKRV
jgi:hypothetical protein